MSSEIICGIPFHAAYIRCCRNNGTLTGKMRLGVRLCWFVRGGRARDGDDVEVVDEDPKDLLGDI